MAKEMAVSEIEEFLSGPLFTWFSSCVETRTDEKLSYEELVDGFLIHHVFLQMDLQARENDISPAGDDAMLRSRNLRAILSNIRHFYEDVKGHLILRPPNVSRLAKEPRLHVREAELMLYLLLGCAVQCPNNEEFISRITQLDEPIQQSIAECIKQVVHIPNVVLSPDMLTNPDTEDSDDWHQTNVRKAFEHLRNLHKEYEKVRHVARQIRHHDIEDEEPLPLGFLDCSTRSEHEDALKRDAELLELKAKVRVQRQEIKEKCDDLQECREELGFSKTQLAKMQKEIERLVSEARSAKSYRDELDAANEKIEKVDRLEQEIARYKEKLADVDFYKTRLNELREDNQLLVENKEMLVEQVDSYKMKAAKVQDLEKQILNLKRQVEELTLENAANREKYLEVCEENAELERLVKVSTKEALDSGFSMDLEDTPATIMNSSLSEQLTTSAQSHALKLELENRRLSNLVDSLKENSFHEKSSKLLDLEKEKKKLSLLVEALREDIKKLNRKNEELETLCKKALAENDKLQQHDLKDLNSKCIELEKMHAADMTEKVQLQTLLESVQKRSLEIERDLKDANQKLEKKKMIKDTTDEIKIKHTEIINKKLAVIDDVAKTENQIALKLANSQLAAEKEILQKAREKLSSDKEHLKALHDQLNVDYQQVLKERNLLRNQLRDAKSQLRRQSESISSLEESYKLLEDEYRSFKSSNFMLEHTQLKEDFGKLYTNYKQLISRHSHTKITLNKLSIMQASHQKELDAKNKKIIDLDIELSKINNRCDILIHLNKVLLQDKTLLMDNVSQLLKQNHELIAQSLEDKEHYHNEERKNTDRMNNLSRQKEKLEEKIMDHYKKLENCSAKKKSGANIVKTTFSKVRRAGSELFNRSRRSWAEETTPACERSYDFEYCRGHESDVSLDDHRTRIPRESSVSQYSCITSPKYRKSVDFFANFCPNDFTFDGIEENDKSRKSMDFMECCPPKNNEENEDDLDRTLHDTTNDDKLSNTKNEEDLSLFSKTKSVDLSLEEDENAANDMENNKSNEVDTKEEEKNELKTRQETWLEYGCV